MENTDTIEQVDAPPQQADPPSKKLYDGLVSEKLYTKSYDDFQKQFSTPDAINKLHQGLQEEKLYTKGADEFQKQFFPITQKKNLVGNDSGNGVSTGGYGGIDVKAAAQQFEQERNNEDRNIVSSPKDVFSFNNLDHTKPQVTVPEWQPPQSLHEATEQDKSTSKYMVGNLYNSLLHGYSSITAGMSDLTGQLIIKMMPPEPGMTKEESLKKFRNEFLPAVRTGNEDLIGANVTPKEKENFNNNFWTSALGGITESLPGILSPSGSGLLAQAYDGGLQAINSSKEGQALPESTKTIFAGGLGAAQAVIFKLGLDKIFGKQSTKVASNLAIRTFSKLISESEAPITAEAFESALNAAGNDLKSQVIKAGGKIASSAATGAVMGGAIEGTNILAKEIMNKSQNKNIFEPTSWGQKVSQIAHAAASNAVGGGLLGIAALPFSQTRNYIAEKVADAKSSDDITALKQELAAKSPEMTPEETQQLNGLIDQYVRVNSKIPDTVPNRKEAAEKIIEREDIQNEVAKKQDEAANVDEAFKPAIHDEINALNGRANEINQEIATEVPQSTETNSSTDKGTNQNIQSTEETTQSENKSSDAELEKLPPEPPIENTGTGKEGEGNTVGISHDALSNLASRFGLQEPERGTFETSENQANKGRQLLDAGADVGAILSKVDKGTPLEPDEISILRAHLEGLTKIADNLRKKSPTSREYQLAKNDVNTLSQIIKKSGTKAGETLYAFKGMRDIDEGSFTSVGSAVENETGKPLNADQQKKIDELTTENARLKKEAEDLNKKTIEETDKNIGNKKSKETKPKKTHEDYAKERKAAFDKAREALKKLRTGQSGLTVRVPLLNELAAIAPHITKIVSSLIEEGVDKLVDIVDAIHDELKDDMEGLRRRDIIDLINGDYNKKEDAKRNPISEKLAEIRKQVSLTKKLEDLQNGLPEDYDKDKTDQSPEVKALLAKIKNVKDELKAIDYMNENKKKISTEEQNIKRLNAEIARLQEEGKLKDKTNKRELSDKEKELQKQKVQEEVKIQQKDLIKQFADKRPKDKKFTVDEAASLWGYAKKKYLDNGTGYIDAIQKVADDVGLTLQQVSTAFESPKTKPISDVMWAKQRALSRSKLKVNDYIDNQNMNPILKFAKSVTKFPKSVATFLHGHIFPGTHYPMGFVTPSQWGIYFNGIGKSWRNAYGSEAYHAKEVQALKSRPLYNVFKRAGLQNDVENTNIDDFEKGGKLLGALGRTGTKGFLGMKWIRQMMAEDYYKAVPENERTKQVQETIAYLVNRATQASNIKIPPAVQELFFSAGMESARWGKLFISPVKAVAASTRILTNMIKGHEVAPEDKVFVKVWGSRVGQQLATLVTLVAANAYIQSKINPKNPVNLTDPTKPDYFKLKADNTDIDLTGGVLGIKNFLTSIATYAVKDKNANQEVGDIGGKSLKYLRGKLSPLYGDVGDVVFGTDYKGNPVPYRDKKVTEGHHKLGWGEYFFSKAPIFIANAVENMYDNAEDNGIPKSQTDKIVNGIISGVITTGTGVHTMDSYQSPPPTFSEEELKDPILKPFSDAISNMPKTNLKTEEVTNEKEGTKKNISDFPKETQDQYLTDHKQALKDELSKIEEKGRVYVKYYKDANGKEISKVSLEPPETKSTKVSVDNLSADEKTQVLKLAQSEATTKTKKKLFGKPKL